MLRLTAIGVLGFVVAGVLVVATATVGRKLGWIESDSYICHVPLPAIDAAAL